MQRTVDGQIDGIAVGSGKRTSMEVGRGGQGLTRQGGRGQHARGMRRGR